MENNSEKRIDKMNNEEILLIKKAFQDYRDLKETPPEIRKVDNKFYQGGSVYTTEDGEFIDLEIQDRDYDIEDHINYIEYAEALYERHEKKVNIYVYCIPSVKINIQLYEIPSEANFKIRLVQIREDSRFQRIKSRIIGE